MKRFAFIALLVCSVTVAFAQEARVNKAQGKYVFYYNEPVAKYEVVFSFKTDAVNGCLTISGLVDAMLKAALYEAGVQSKQFDAIIVGAGERDLAIKFLESNADNSLATPQRNNGKYFYVFSEPAKEYQVVEKLKVFRANQMTGGCRSVSAMVDEIVKDALKGEKKGKTFSAIIIGNDQFHNSVSF